MPSADTAIYARAMMELLAKSSNASASQLSGVGRSAITDWYAVMAIEDYRGVAFRRNQGLRIDLMLASVKLGQMCRTCRIDKEPRGWERPSDHVPVIAEFTLP